MFKISGRYVMTEALSELSYPRDQMGFLLCNSKVVSTRLYSVPKRCEQKYERLLQSAYVQCLLVEESLETAVAYDLRPGDACAMPSLGVQGRIAVSGEIIEE
jgi:hypothetical protein